ncbi:MAG: DUF5685 family protein [Oscillospiraceae bacterium]|nr:DUF5685 family protein [Oscillospiraceae bacterium]
MFGYVRPFKPELKIREFETYKAVYCGLCSQLGRSFGVLARLTLSYDFTFLSMLCAGVSDEEPGFERKRCCVNPLRTVPMCRPGRTQSFSADIAALMIYHKLLDNIRDSGILKKMGWRLLYPFARRAYKKAARARPEAEAVISDAMARQTGVESADNTSLDAACEPSADAMAGIFALLSEDDSQKRVLERMGYLIGRYVYICDALDDFEKDEKTGNYNPLVLRYRGGDHDGRAGLFAGARQSLFLTIGEIEKTGDLLDFNNYQPIILNIISMGLRSGVEEILAKKEK